MPKYLYVKQERFSNKQAALDYCKKHGLSPTLIHSAPCK